MPFADPQRAKEYQKAYLAKNPSSKEKMREYQRAWREKNREKLREMSREYERSLPRQEYVKEKSKRRWASIAADPEKRQRDLEYKRAYYANNKEKYKAWAKDNWRNRDKDRAKSARRKQRYGLSSEEYLALLKHQNGVCAICRIKEPTTVDHCHSTSTVRGLLCHGCNVALGLFKDSPSTLRIAIEYLNQPKTPLNCDADEFTIKSNKRTLL